MTLHSIFRLEILKVSSLDSHIYDLLISDWVEIINEKMQPNVGLPRRDSISIDDGECER